MKKSKMLKEDLKSLREQENAEIVQHLEARMFNNYFLNYLYHNLSQ